MDLVSISIDLGDLPLLGPHSEFYTRCLVLQGIYTIMIFIGSDKLVSMATSWE